MKRFLLWSFERGSIQYDVICVVILAFIFLTPPSAFNDRPDFVQVSADDEGHTVFTVKIEMPQVSSAKIIEQAALARLKESLGAPFKVSRMEPVYDTDGALVAYSIWIEE
jgi:hypothetical protein